jgi:hypothetical protein
MLTFVFMGEDTCKTKEQLVILIILTALVVVVKVRKQEFMCSSQSHIWFCHVVTQLKKKKKEKKHILKQKK